MNDTSKPEIEERVLPPVSHERAARRNWLRRPWFWLLLVCIAGAAAYFYFRQPVSPDQVQTKAGRRGMDAAGGPMPVIVTPATTSDVNVYLTALGTITALNTVTVKPQVSGPLTKVLFQEGQVVKAGDLLAEIDSRPFQAQLAQFQGQLARDKALLAGARVDLERYKTLVAQDSIATQTLDTQAALVRQYEGAVKADQGQVDNARLQLSYTRITAPIEGRAGLRQIDPGNIVQTSDSNGVVVITQLQPITAIFSIPEDSLQGLLKKLQAGQKFPVDAYNRSGETKLASGTLLTIDNQIDTSTGTVKLKAKFSNEDYGLFPNQFVNVRMLVDVKRGAVVIPSAAIMRGNPPTFVYVARSDNTVTVRPLKLGPSEGQVTAVESGLAPGEVVVVDGHDKLREGAKVQVAQRDATGPAAAATASAKDGGEAKKGNGRRHRPDDNVSPAASK